MSLPMRERGLKLKQKEVAAGESVVAPHAGAWIETLAVDLDFLEFASLPMRERGLKPL